MNTLIIAPPAIGDVVQCWPLLQDAFEEGCGVYASEPVQLWIKHYLKWSPRKLLDLALDFNGETIIDFHGDDDILRLISMSSATDVIGFAWAGQYTIRYPFIQENCSLYDWYVDFWSSRGRTIPKQFPFLPAPGGITFSNSVVIFPHSSCLEKNWPLSYFLSLAEQLVEHNWTVKWMLPHRSIDYFVQTYALPEGVEGVTLDSWEETFELIDNTNVIVANDGSPMHVAAACRKRVVGIFVRSAKSIWFPYKSNHILAIGSGNFERPEGHWIPTVTEVFDAIMATVSANETYTGTNNLHA